MYRTVETGMWDDPRIIELPHASQLLWAYLMTNRYTHVSGLYVLMPPVVEHHLKYDAGEQRAILARLLDTKRPEKTPPGDLGLVEWDEERHLIWIVNYFHHQARGSSNDIHAARHLATFNGSPLVERFLERYPQVRPYFDARSKTQKNQHNKQRVIERESNTLSRRDREKRSGIGEGGEKPFGLTDVVTADWVQKEWNAICGVKPCQALGVSIKGRVLATIKRYQDVSWWEAFFLKVGTSDWLCGRAEYRGDPFAATLSWALAPANLDKILAGDYTSKKKGSWRTTSEKPS